MTAASEARTRSLALVVVVQYLTIIHPNLGADRRPLYARPAPYVRTRWIRAARPSTIDRNTEEIEETPAKWGNPRSVNTRTLGSGHRPFRGTGLPSSRLVIEAMAERPRPPWARTAYPICVIFPSPRERTSSAMGVQFIPEVVSCDIDTNLDVTQPYTGALSRPGEQAWYV